MHNLKISMTESDRTSKSHDLIWWGARKSWDSGRFLSIPTPGMGGGIPALGMPEQTKVNNKLK